MLLFIEGLGYAASNINDDNDVGTLALFAIDVDNRLNTFETINDVVKPHPLDRGFV